MSWEAVTYARTYRVYRNGAMLAEVSATSYLDATAADGGPPQAPMAVTAAEGSHVDRVDIAWQAAQTAPGPTYTYFVTALNESGESSPSAPDSGYRAAYPVTGYGVHRDDVWLGDVTATRFADTSAAAGVLPAPRDFAASQGTHTAAVELAWSAPVPLAGATHEYAVSALNAAGESPRSEGEIGFRAAPAISGYELSIEGSSFTDVGLATAYSDADAPPAVLTAGVASASNGGHPSYVTLVLLGSAATPAGSRSYVLRAIGNLGSGAETDGVSGFRGVGPLAFQWERSAENSDRQYSPLADATTASWQDESDTPSAGEVRYYRCQVSAEGAGTFVSNADQGWRFLPPDDEPRRDTWVTDGPVYAVAQVGGTLYMGGDFTYVGPPTGSFAALDDSSGAADVLRARANGVVWAAEPDGSGGWYIGGTFTHVDGIPRSRLARITPRAPSTSIGFPQQTTR